MYYFTKLLLLCDSIVWIRLPARCSDLTYRISLQVSIVRQSVRQDYMEMTAKMFADAITIHHAIHKLEYAFVIKDGVVLIAQNHAVQAFMA